MLSIQPQYDAIKKDGQQLIQQYKDLGPDLEFAFNGVESGLYEAGSDFQQGRLKVFRSLSIGSQNIACIDETRRGRR